MEDQQATNKLALVADVVSSYLRRNSISAEDIGKVVASVTKAMSDAEKMLGGVEIGNGRAAEEPRGEETRQPAVSPRSSVKQDYIICLDCGAKVKTLKRHLQSAHGLDPRQYRERWALKKDYPMTAPAYSERRSQMARDLGLGRKAGEAAPKPRRGRRKSGSGPAGPA